MKIIIQKNNMSENTFRISNIVLTAKLASHVYIKNAIQKIGFGKYDPKSFSALLLKFTNPKASVSIFSSGTIIVMGVSCIHAGFYVVKKISEMLEIKLLSCCVSNVMAHYTYEKNVNLNEFFEKNRDDCVIDYRVFPNCVYKIKEIGSTASIHESGKINVYGCKTIEDIEKSIAFIVEKLKF